MTYYDEQLQELQQQTAKKLQMEKKLKDLEQQNQNLKAKATELETAMRKEQSDVDRLEKHSLSAIFYQLTGQKEDKLTKEREEAYAATLKYQTAASELSAVQESIRFYMAELQALQGCEERYAKTLSQKSDAIKASGTPEASEILTCEEQISYLNNQKIEVQEAMDAGHRALDLTDAVLDKLRSAENWGTWDVFGGGLISDLAKHDALDSAQRIVEQLQMQLRSFKTELADITIDTNLQVNIDDFLRFADFFFDGIFADWTVLNKISKSIAQVQDTRDQIETVLDKLSYMLSVSDAKQNELEKKLEDLIRRTPL